MGEPTLTTNLHIRHDGSLTVATGRSRKETSWKNREYLWSDLVQRLSQPHMTGETLDEYRAMTKAQQDDVKDVGGFVGGALHGGRRKSDAVKWRQLVTLDADNVRGDLWGAVELLCDFAAVIYSTHSHSPERPRLRLVVPLSRPVTADEYQAVSRRIAADLGIDMFDATTYEPHRLMYWPSSPVDVEPVFEVQDLAWLDPDEVLASYPDWRDPSFWPESATTIKARERLAARQEDPLSKSGIIGAFCRTYTITAVIETFLGGVYEPAGEGRYTYTAGTTTGGLVVYDSDTFAYSHHGTDPIGGRLVNAFDLVRLHRFGERDDEATPGTPVARLPSYLAMVELASADGAVKELMGKEQLAAAGADFSASEDMSWLKRLRRNPNTGVILCEAPNIKLILQNDPNLAGKFALDDFSHRAILTEPVPWRDLERGANWTDHDDAGLRNYLSEVYQVKGPGVIQDAVMEVLLQNAFHPVRDYLDGLQWDGRPRVETLLVDYLGADDSPYTRAVTRKMLAAAVARVFVPGIKFDHILVLVGPQGVGKSLLINRLGRSWYSDSLDDMRGKDAYEQLQGVWLMELGELAATRRADVEVVKHFISKQQDIFRVAYGRHTSIFPRQCVFFGSTNEPVFLKDRTGNRRFWPVPVRRGPHPRSLWDELTDEEVSQVWAEAVTLWRAGEPLYLEPHFEAEALQHQEMHTEESERAGMIQEFVETLLPDNWDEMEIHERRSYLQGNDFGEQPKGTTQRERVCAIEVWVELFNGDPRQLTPAQSREINDTLRQLPGWRPYEGSRGRLKFGRHYGLQRAFVRVENGNF